MDFNLTDDQQSIRSLAEQFARDEMQPYAEQCDRENIFPVDAVKKAASLGFAGIYTRDEHGGSGLGRVDAAIILEALSEACVSTAMGRNCTPHAGYVPGSPSH